MELHNVERENSKILGQFLISTLDLLLIDVHKQQAIHIKSEQVEGSSQHDFSVENLFSSFSMLLASRQSVGNVIFRVGTQSRKDRKGHCG